MHAFQLTGKTCYEPPPETHERSLDEIGCGLKVSIFIIIYGAKLECQLFESKLAMTALKNLGVKIIVESL